MLLTRRRRKENKEIKIYLHNRPLIQVNSMRYLGIIFDHKLTFKGHINYMSEKCTKLIFALSKSAKLIWGLQHAALKTIYRVSQEECARLWESVPYVKVYQYNPKHLYPKLNGYGDNGQRKVRSSCGSTYCTCSADALHAHCACP